MTVDLYFPGELVRREERVGAVAVGVVLVERAGGVVFFDQVERALAVPAALPRGKDWRSGGA
jgi:hypothetical protein